MDIEGFLHPHICYLAFSSGAVTICYYDLGLLRLGIGQPIFRMQGEFSNKLFPRRSSNELGHRRSTIMCRTV